MAAGATQYYDVEQRTPEWHALRRIIGGSSVGAETGLSPYRHPKKKDDNKPNARRDAAFAHGEKYEPRSVDVFLEWLRGDAGKAGFDEDALKKWREQKYDVNPGYDVPLYPHPYFVNRDDQALFGVSLDMRGSVVDVEIKNPTTYLSFLRSYVRKMQPVYFAQVQWGMAMRVRREMFFVATSFEAETGVHFATVVWHVTFAENFFRDWLYPRARLAALSLMGGEENPVNWANDSGEFEASDYYKQLCAVHCRQVYLWKNGKEIARAIREKKSAQ